MMKKFSGFLVGLIAFAPSLVLAQNTTAGTLNNVEDLLATGLTWINVYIIPGIIAIALLVFFWGIVQYIRKTGDEGERAAARQLMLWGIIALFVMVSAWGLVRLLQNTLGVQNTPITAPSVPRGTR